jgi:hypothetical protein
LAWSAAPTHAEIIYVDASASGGNTGQSWPDAYTDLQDALSRAAPGDEVWIAAGTYRPASAAGSIDLSFVVPGGVTMLGGFSGGEVSASERDPISNLCILNGDLLGDDAGGFENYQDNSRTVVRMAASRQTSIIDGVTIRGGQGVSDEGSEPLAGGLHVADACVIVQGCIITENDSLAGGGVVCTDGARVVFTACEVSANYSFSRAAAVLVRADAQATLLTCSITGNTSGQDGAALAGEGSSTFRVVDCLLMANFSVRSSAVSFKESCAGLIERSRIVGNTAYFSGAVELGSQVPGEIVGSMFTGNSVLIAGASALRITNHAFIRQCSFTRNTFAGPNPFGAGTIAVINAVARIDNSIVWGNPSTMFGRVPAVVVSGFGGAVQICHSLVEGLSESFCGDSSIDSDPLFVNVAGTDGIVGTSDDNVELALGSPCIDTGDPGFPVSGVDAWGGPRVLDGNLDGLSVVDMGAREFGHARITCGPNPVSSGETVSVAIEGTPGMAGILFVAIQRGETPFEPFGSLLFEPTGGFVRMNLGGIPTGLTAAVDARDPATVLLQALALDAASGFGTLSNAIALEIRP